MEMVKCGVKKCERRGFILYGSMWICGNCMMKIVGDEINRKNKQIEELGNAN